MIGSFRAGLAGINLPIACLCGEMKLKIVPRLISEKQYCDQDSSERWQLVAEEQR